MKIDKEFKNLIPPLSPDEKSGLESSIKAEGCRDEICVWGDIIVDGHNRYEICERLDIPYRVKAMSFVDRLDAMAWMIRNQRSRRNLTPSQHGCLALLEGELLSKIAMRDRAKKGGHAKHGTDYCLSAASADKQPEEPKIDTRKASAKAHGISERTVRKCKEVKEAKPELFQQLLSGEVELADAVREVKREAVVAKLEDIKVKEAKALVGVYDVIVIDPPWAMEKIERDERPNQSEFDYPTMSEDELEKLKIPCADDCHVWVWTTHKFLPMALRLLDAWGLKYVCTFVWHKNGGFQPIGLPQYNCEFAVYARKGTPKFVDTKAFNTCFDATRGKHSEKPGEFYDVVRRVTAGRRLDMFNRRDIHGFDTWGNEA